MIWSIRARGLFTWRKRIVAELNAIEQTALQTTGPQSSSLHITTRRCGSILEDISPEVAELNYLPTDTKKRVAVVGAGAAGMQAALVLDQRGHAVTLFEAADKIGGQLNMAAAIPGKEEFHSMLAYFARVLDLSDGEIRLSTRATVEDLSGYDEVILATGVTARDPGIEGQDHPKVLSYIERC